jgi:hypothetical protein
LAYLGTLRHLHARYKVGGATMTLYIDTRPTLEWVNDSGKYIDYKSGYRVHYEHLANKWFWTYYENCIHEALYDTLDQAKAAAQADYEARTSERFRKVEVPKRVIPYQSDNAPYNTREPYDNGFNYAIELIEQAIAKATTPESLHTKP